MRCGAQVSAAVYSAGRVSSPAERRLYRQQGQTSATIEKMAPTVLTVQVLRSSMLSGSDQAAETGPPAAIVAQ